MKKIFTIAIAIALLATLLIGSTVSADDPTEVNIEWDGAGLVETTVNAGDDAVTTFSTAGAYIKGSFNAVDSNNNPYSYGVDSYTTYLNAEVTGGWMEMVTDRLTSKTSMYGPAGQQSGIFVGTTGTASVAQRTTTNYAAMKDPTYTYQLTGGHNVVVDGVYELNRWILDGQGNRGYVYSYGEGSAVLDSMSTESSGNGGIRLGWGCGCYTDASYTATGSGYFEATGVGNTKVKYEGLGIESGGGSLSIIADFVNGFNIADYSLTAK